MSEAKYTKLSKAKKFKKGCLGCAKFMYNKEDGTVFGRTGKRWFLLFVFYVIFFGLLAGFFSLLLYIFMTVFITDNMPYQTGEHSLLISKAGLNVYPRLTVEDALIIISTNPADPQSVKYESEVGLLFKKTFDIGQNNASSCPTSRDQPSDISKFCKYDKEQLGPCMDPIGQMRQSKLCVFIRVNKVYGWLPSIANNSISQDILVDCEGQNTGDIVNLRTPTYYPSFQNGSKSYGLISNKFFPFISQKGYVSPMVAVQFPEMKNNTAILIQCQIKNLNNNYKNVKFEVMLMDKRVK